MPADAGISPLVLNMNLDFPHLLVFLGTTLQHKELLGEMADSRAGSGNTHSEPEHHAEPGKEKVFRTMQNQTKSPQRWNSVRD